MKLTYDVSEMECVTTFEFNGHTYKRVWKYEGDGHYKSKDDSLDEQIEKAGCANEDVLEQIYDVLENTFEIDLMKLAEFEE